MKNNGWSYYFQNIPQMKAARLMIINTEMRPMLGKWLGLREGMKILDVGCGLGSFTYYLGAEVSNCSLVGVDLDCDYIAEAQKQPAAGRGNSYEFIEADGMALPFADDSFDLVVSHTYLTSVPDPARALNEKIRVAKRGAVVASVTAQSFKSIPKSSGAWPKDMAPAIRRLNQLSDEFTRIIWSQSPISGFCEQHPPEAIPFLFGQARLDNIEAHGIPLMFSLSNAALPEAVRREYIELSYEGELLRLARAREKEENRALLSEEFVQEYTELLGQKKAYLLARLNNNKCWEWVGGSSVLMLGYKPRAYELLDIINRALSN